MRVAPAWSRLAAFATLVSAAALAGADDVSKAPASPQAGTPPPPGPSGSIAVDRDVHDFGAVRQESVQHTTFTLRNEGKGVLHLTGTSADCGCSVATLSTHEIAPGGSAPLEVTLRTFAMSGALAKRIRVLSDDPKKPELELHLKLDVAAGIVLEPGRLDFGAVLVGTSPTASARLEWKDGVGRPFRILGIEAPGVDLRIETTPYDAPPWHGFTLTARFPKPPTEVRTLSASALVRTDDPDTPHVVVPITAFVSGKVWLDRRELKLGFVPQGDARATIVGCRGLTPDVDLGTVAVTAKGERVRARVLATATKGEWLVEVKVSEAAKPGRIDETIEVASSIPREPPATIHVTGEVLAAGAR